MTEKWEEKTKPQLEGKRMHDCKQKEQPGIGDTIGHTKFEENTII